MSHQLPGAIPSLRSGTVIVDELEECSDGDVEDELLPELVDNPGTRGGAKLSVLLMIVFHSFDPLMEASVVFHSFPTDGTANVSSSNCTIASYFKS